MDGWMNGYPNGLVSGPSLRAAHCKASHSHQSKKSVYHKWDPPKRFYEQKQCFVNWFQPISSPVAALDEWDRHSQWCGADISPDQCRWQCWGLKFACSHRNALGYHSNSVINTVINLCSMHSEARSISTNERTKRKKFVQSLCQRNQSFGILCTHIKNIS